jgi:ubiquinone/menaquinone biosynthesis C-methylase UbiE
VFLSKFSAISELEVFKLKFESAQDVSVSAAAPEEFAGDGPGMNDRTFRAAHAHKLDDPRRREWLPPGDVLHALPSLKGITVGDIGAGTGYFTLPMAQLPEGPQLIYAVDIQAEMLSLLQSKLSAEEAAKVRLINGSATESTLPDGSCDLLLLANIWHELDDTANVLAEARRVLKQGGTLAILDWRADVEPEFGPPMEHRISADLVEKQLTESGGSNLNQQQIGRYSYLIQAQLREPSNHCSNNPA